MWPHQLFKFGEVGGEAINAGLSSRAKGSTEKISQERQSRCRAIYHTTHLF